LLEESTKIVKQKIKKKKEFLKVKNIRFSNYLKRIKISNRSKYIVENSIIEDSLSIINFNSRIIKY